MSSSGSLTLAERRAQLRLEPFVGILERLDVPGTSGACDFEVVGPPDVGGVVEATEWVDTARARLDGALREQNEFRIGTSTAWTVHLFRTARVNLVLVDAQLAALLAAADARGLRFLSRALGDPELNAAFDRLRIESVSGYKSRPGGEGLVRASWGASAGWGWDGTTIAAWIVNELLPSDLILRKLRKLEASGADPRHLYVGVDARGSEGLGLSLALETTTSEGAAALEIPSLALPRAMTSLWIWPNGPFPGLRFDSAGASTIVFETVETGERLWRGVESG